MGGKDFFEARTRSLVGGAAVVVGELLAIAEQGRTPLVRYPGQPGSAALRARSTVDLFEPHVGAEVVLAFEDGDPERPIVMGVLRHGRSDPEAGAPVVVETDGARLVVEAKERLVLRCGRACVTLTAAGKVLLEGTYVSSRSSGVNRIKGGSVQLN